MPSPRRPPRWGPTRPTAPSCGCWLTAGGDPLPPPPPRRIGKAQRTPPAGIPHHALDSYLAKLIAKGYKVAICEQMEQPGKGKTLVDRQVVRVVSPGTLGEDHLLQRGAHNYLAALAPGNGSAGLAYVDVSTGEFACTQLDAGGEAPPPELGRPPPGGGGA